MDDFNALNARLLTQYKQAGSDALVWAEPSIFDSSIYIPVTDTVVGALTTEEKNKLTEFPIKLTTTMFEAGAILDALMVEMEQFTTLVQQFPIISPMINWGNFKALHAHLTKLVSEEVITTEVMNAVIVLIETVKPNVDWNSSGATEK